jgi:hypothetical protein
VRVWPVKPIGLHGLPPHVSRPLKAMRGSGESCRSLLLGLVKG